MGSIRSALIYSAASQYILKALSLISVIAVARLLTPAEVGVFAIASSLVLITGELKSLGAGTYLIRAEKLDDATIKSATGLMMLISWSMGGLLFFLSPWLAVFYQVPDLKIILRLLSYSFFLAPFISIPRALLTRDLKFKAIFYISIITQLTLLISTIIFILLGFSYFSLAYASVIGYTIELVLTLVFRPQGTPWLPAFTNLLRILKFGIYVTFGNLFAKFSLSLPDLIIGKQGTAAEVALFSRGVGFLDFVSNTLKQGITPVAMPYLSEQKRLGHPLEEPYLKATMLLGVIVWPALAVAGIVSSPIILLFFGPQWADTAPLVSILCLWGLFRNIHSLAPPLLVTAGKEKQLCIKQGVLFLGYAGSIWLCYPFGLQSVGWGLVGIAAVDFIYSTALLQVSLNFKPSKLLRSATANIVITLICALSAYILFSLLNIREVGELTSLAFIAPSVMVVWLLGLKLSRHDLWDELTTLYKRSV